MNIEAIKASVTTNIQHTFDIGKQFVSWCGHKLQTGFTNYLLPFIQRAWTWAAANFTHVRNLIKTGPGATFAVAATLFLAGVAAFKIADHKAHEENIIAKTAWKALGISAFVCATMTTSLGIAAVLAI